MYKISIIGASDSRDTYENVSNYRMFLSEEINCRILIINFSDGSSILIYLGINDRVEIHKEGQLWM